MGRLWCHAVPGGDRHRGDRPHGLLKDVTIALNDAGGNILSAATQTSSEGVARLRFLIAISDASILDALLASVSRVPSVFDARRIMPGEGSNQMKRRV